MNPPYVAAASLERLLPGDMVGEVAFSPDSRLLVTCGQDAYRFWRTSDWTAVFSVARNDTGDSSGMVDFALDGSMVAIAPTARLIRLLDPATGRELANLEPPGPLANGWFAFSPDCTQLAVSGWKHPVQLWDLRLIRHELAALRLDWDSPPAKR